MTHTATIIEGHIIDTGCNECKDAEIDCTSLHDTRSSWRVCEHVANRAIAAAKERTNRAETRLRSLTRELEDVKWLTPSARRVDDIPFLLREEIMTLHGRLQNVDDEMMDLDYAIIDAKAETKAAQKRVVELEKELREARAAKTTLEATLRRVRTDAETQVSAMNARLARAKSRILAVFEDI